MAEQLLRPQDRRDPLLRRAQAIFDAQSFDRVYPQLSPRDAKVRHIREHIGKATLKLIEMKRNATQVETRLVASRLSHEVVPDLLIYRTQLANTVHINLLKQVAELEVTPVDLSEAIELVAHAGGVLDYRTEPLEHGSPSTSASKREIARHTLPELHLAAHGLAQYYQLGDPKDLHAARLIHLSEQPGLGL